MKQEQNYNTTDLGLAAALVSQGFNVIELDRSHPHKVRFLFTDDGSIEQIASQYWSDKLKVPAMAYFNAIKLLKHRIYSN